MTSAASEDKLWRVQGRDFVAGVVSHNGVITEAAPRLHYVKGWKVINLARHCLNRGWRLTRVTVPAVS